MATTISTATLSSFSSTFTCTTEFTEMYVSIGGTTTSSVTGQWISTPTTPSQNVTFTYSSLGSEPINTGVITFTTNSPAYGGVIKINGEQVYSNAGVYTLYLDDLSVIGTTSTTLTFTYQTYGAVHSHLNDYDSRTLVSQNSGIASETVYVYHYKKNHSSSLTISNLQLKILTGTDAESANKSSNVYVGVNNLAKRVTDIYAGVGNVAKKIVNGWAGVGGVARKIWPCIKLKDVPVGSLIQIDETGNGSIVQYRVMGHDHYAAGNTVLMREKLLINGRQASSTNGSDSYFDQNMDTYLNNTWKATLPGSLIQCLKKTTIKCRTWGGSYGSLVTAERQIWAPALTEITSYEVSDLLAEEGTRFNYFTTHTAYTDLHAYDTNGTKQYWWTRSAVFGTATGKAVSTSSSDPVSNREINYSSATYYRPIFCLSGELPVSPISDGIYDFVP